MQQQQVSLQSNNNQLKEKINLVSPAILNMQQSPNAVQIGQLRKLGNANLQINKGGGGIQMKHGNLLGMQAASASMQTDDQKQMMIINTQRVHAAANPGNSIEFCAEMIAPSSTKSFPTTGKKAVNQAQGSNMQVQQSSQNTLGSGRRTQGGSTTATEDQHVPSAKKKLAPQSNNQQQLLNLQYQSAQLSNQHAHLQQNQQQQQQFKSTKKTVHNTLSSSQQQQTQQKNQLMLSAAAQNAQNVSGMHKKVKNVAQTNAGLSSSGNQMDNIQFANSSNIESQMKRHGFSKNQNDNGTRDNSSNSEKLNNSLLKLKSRNRCNEALKAGGGGAPLEKQTSFPKKIISNKDNSYQGQGAIIQNQISNSSYQEQQQKLNLSQEYLVNPLLNTAPALALASHQTLNSSQKQLASQDFGSSILNTMEQQLSSEKFHPENYHHSNIIPTQSTTKKSIALNQRNSLQKQGNITQEQSVNEGVQPLYAVSKIKKNTDGQVLGTESVERAQTIGIKQLQRSNIVTHNKGSIPPQLDTSQEIFKLGNLGLQNMKKLGMPLTQTNKEQQQKVAVLKGYQQPIMGIKHNQIQNNSITNFTSQGQTEENSSKSPSANPRCIIQQVGKTSGIGQPIIDQGFLLNTERVGMQGSYKLSLSHEFPSSARECEMSTTINYTAGNMMGTTAIMEGTTSQTMLISNVDNSSIMGNSPHNQTLAVPKNGASGSSILQRRAAGSSQHIVSQLAPSQAKRRHYLKTGSVNTQRLTTEENVHSSPSTGGNGMGPQNNASNSIGNKSQHYGLSSQSFLTNSNNSGSQPRETNPSNTTVVVPGPSSARLNSSSLGTSFYNHQRQKSGGFFQQVLSGNIQNNNVQHASKSNTSQLNTSSGAAPLGNTQTVLLKKQSQIVSTNPKQVNFGQQQDSSSALLDASNQSIKATLSGSSLNQAKMMAQSTQIMHNSIQQKLSLSSRQQYNQQNQQQLQQQQQVITSGNVMLKNKSKTSFNGKSSGGPSSSSRSNSIKKRSGLNHKQPTTSTKKNEGVQRNNYMLTSSAGVAEDNEEEPPSPINILDTNKSMTSNQGGGASVKNSMRKSLQQINRLQYNHTVEEVGADLQNMSNASFINQDAPNLMKQQQQLQIFQQLSFSNDPNLNLIQTSTEVLTKKDPKKNKAGPGMNRSVIVEPSQLIVSSRGRIPGKKGGQQMQMTNSDQKNTQMPNNNGVGGIKEFEMMKNELKTKDMLIQNLSDRLQNLEEKVNGIQMTQQVAVAPIQRARNNRTSQDEHGAGGSHSSSDRARDKSQQRIKEAIMNLERKLEQIKTDKELHHLQLQEMKQQYSSSQHSSSRQSEQQLQLQNQKSLQQHLQKMIEAGLLHSPQAFNNRPHTYLMTSSSNEGSGFATHTLGGPPRRQKMKSPNSLKEDLESLITIGEQQNTEEALAAAVIQRDLGIAHYYLEDFVGDGGGHLPIFYDNGGMLLNSNHNTNKRQPLNKIKTPMFENPLKNNLMGSLNDGDEEKVEDELKLFIAQIDRNHYHGHDQQQESGEEDNSCLLMLEKEWQEAQNQKCLEEEMAMMQKSNNNTNMSQLFDQSLIVSSSNHQHNQMQNQVNQSLGGARNNLTQNNIVFFFDEDTTLEEEDDVYQLNVGEADEIALTAQVGREKFVKTQKIEFKQKERNSLGINIPRRTTAGAAKGNNNSLSPSSSDNAQLLKMGAGGPRQLHKPYLNVFSSNKQGQISSSTTNQAIQIQTQQTSNHYPNQQQVVHSQNHQQPPLQTFSRTLSKTTLLAKIRNAIGKSTNPGDAGANTIITVASGGASKKKTVGANGASPKKAQPRRFIVKRSQERNASTSNNPVNNTQVKVTDSRQVIGIQPLKLKTKVTATSGVAARSIQEEIAEQQKSIQLTGGEFHQQQEQLMKTIVQQKEKIALTQKDAIKNERDLSLKLRQAISKLNMKIQIQQTNSGAHNSGGLAAVSAPASSQAIGGSASKKSTTTNANK